VSREQPARNRWDVENFWEIRRKVQKNAGVDCAIGGRTGTFCKDRAGHALLSDCSTNERSAFIAVPLPFLGDEDRIGGSAIAIWARTGLVVDPVLLTSKRWRMQSVCNHSAEYVDQWSHVSSLHSLLMQLCALETHIRISRNLKKFVDLMRNH